MRQALLLFALFVAARCLAEGYPSKPIRFIVPWGAGSAPDIGSRILTTELSKRLGQPIVVDDRPGAGGTVGTALLAKAVPDGYTIGHLSIGATISSSLIPNVSYDLNKDFEMLMQHLFSVNILAVRPTLPVNSVQELIAYAKSKPGKLLYGSFGNGSSSHLSMELFKFMSGTQMVHVPFKDAAQAITGLTGGQVDTMFDNMGSILPHVKSGRVRGLAVTGPTRSAAIPELPTVSEAGVPGFEVTVWAGVAGPRGLPKDVVAKLNTELNKSLEAQSLRDRFAALGFEPVGGTPEEFAAFVRKETERWAQVVKRVGARVD